MDGGDSSGEARARAALARLVADRREDYAGLSRLLGRNASYIQQYVKRGSPRRLAEADRRRLAAYFGVAESVLGGPADPAPRIAHAGAGPRVDADAIAIPRLVVTASAGPGALAATERVAAEMLFAPALLRELGVGRATAVSLIRVEGDSMLPTLGPGDDIMVDADDGADRLRDGIYVLRVGDALIVKRLATGPGKTIAITSDNPRASPDWSGVDPAELAIVGRVVWAGRRLR